MNGADVGEGAGRPAVEKLYAEVGRVVVGQHALVERLLIGLLAGGHVLVEGVPGLAKTLAVRTFAAALDLGFRRVQFTPDLLPADVIGAQVLNPRTGEFSVRKGPVFTNVLLADEINRAPAKVQSALLEAMQEHQVTIGEQSFPLEEPFFVLATQNPIEQEGTYPLPEAQVDRFMLKLCLDYPTREEEVAILGRMEPVSPDVSAAAVLGPADLAELRTGVNGVYVDQRLRGYVADVIRATRAPGEFGLDFGPYVEFGGSPRAGVFLLRAAKAHAFLAGRGFVTPRDVKALAPDVLRHRILLTYEAEADGVSADAVVRSVLDGVAVP